MTNAENTAEGSKPNLLKVSEFDPTRRIVRIADREIKIGGPIPKVRDGERLIRYTQSICPYCYRLLPAVIVERDGKYYIRKVCPEHGEIEEVYQGSAEWARRIEKWFVEGRGSRYVYTDVTAPCPFSCGLCPLHKNHTALANLVATNRCDLDCWYCFFFAEKVGYVYEPTIEQIKFMVQQYLKQGITPVIQITGGEPTLREDLVDIVKLLKEMGVTHIQLNTNITKFAKLYLTKGEEEAVKYAKALRKAGVNTVYMSFDGISPKANPKNHWEVPFAFEVFRKAGMTSVVLVPTVIKGVNTDELGDIIRFAAMNQDIVRAVNFQPVSLTGAIKKGDRMKLRVTMYDTVKLIEEQTNGQITAEDWYPIPVSVSFSEFAEALAGRFKFEMANHPECGVATYIYVRRDSEGNFEFIPIGRMIDIEGFLDYLLQKAEELESGKSKLLVGTKMLFNVFNKFIKWDNVPSELKKTLPKVLYNIFTKQSYDALGEWHYKFMFLGMMHFMDLYNYDVERVVRCNIHYLMPDGRMIPFCTFNVLNDIYRDYVQKKYMIPIEEWKKLKGENTIGEAIKYRRNLELIKKMTSHPLYRKTYGPFIERWKKLYPWLEVQGSEA
ncbi:MAG: radical SAM protein [Desulfurococcales archaeon]|nr:radical SAM protein [Desulfurococcales archaeon]